MKIIKLISENVKGLKAVEIVPDEHFQLISGKNGQGKTSVLDSIWLAVGGKDAAKGVDKPIRDGEQTAFAQVDLGDIIVTRKWKGDKTSLDVTSKQGAKFPSPQGMLDDLIGKLSFDPLSFANMDEKKQKVTLQELVGINFTKLDVERKGWYEERTFNNVSAKKLEGALEELPYPKDGLPDEELSASDILTELKVAQDVTNQNSAKRSELERKRSDVAKFNDDIESLSAELEALQKRLENKLNAHEALSTEADALAEIVESLVDPDTTELNEKLQNVEAINFKVKQKKEHIRITTEIDSYKEASAFLTKKIEEIDQLKLDTLQSAAFPIAGLSFNEDGVIFNDIPFKQCSAAERLKISMAMAMSLNPKLRVIRILDGSLLDSDNLTLIHDMAIEKDYQVWIEVVDNSGKLGIQIEDGQVKEEAMV